MKRKYKLLDRNLIRHFGKVEIELESQVGDRFVQGGKAILPGSVKNKMTYGPPNHKAIFKAPEDKAIEDISNGDTQRYPGAEDKLLPHLIK